MTLQMTRTKAETALAEHFERALGRLPGEGWMREMRKAAFARFAGQGLPHRRIEEWKYTDLRARMREAFVPAAAAAPAAAPSPSLVEALGAELAGLDCIEVLFVDGRFVRAEMRASQAPGSGYDLDTLAKTAGAKAFDWLKPHLASEATAAGPLLALNTAFASDGAVLRIAAGATLAVPIHLVFLAQSAASQASTVRNVIEVGAGAAATILESHVGIGAASRQANAATQIEIGAGAKVTHVKLTAEGERSIHLASTIARIGAEATYRVFQMTAGTGLVRNEIVATFAGERASLDASGVYLALGDDHIDTTLVVDHAVPACESRELFKAVLGGRARGVFQGKLVVRPGAQKTDAKQMAQALLLSEDAEFDSKPELEIYADDVACGHGSTSGRIDEELLFYLMSRGIPRAEASALLVTAFVGEALEKVLDEPVREALAAFAARRLAAGR